MAEKACADNGYEVDPEISEFFSTHRKTTYLAVLQYFYGIFTNNKKHGYLQTKEESIILAHIFGSELICENRLYKNEHKGQYLLVVNQRALSAEAFGKVCNTISEYGVTTSFHFPH